MVQVAPVPRPLPLVTNKTGAGLFLPTSPIQSFRHRLGAVRFSDISLKQSQIKRAPDGTFFGNDVHAYFISGRHRAATGL